MNNKYEEDKNKIRDEAIEFQMTASQYDYSYSELAEKYQYFLKNGRKYGLIREFKENGIL